MRYAVIMAGGAGTRLWPMSRARLPKQLVPFINGESLLEVAYRRLEGVVPSGNRYICASERHRDAIIDALGIHPSQFIGEPVGRDTVNAVGLSAAVIGKRDADAAIGVFTADHIIEPVDKFRTIVDEGYRLAEINANAMVTFGIRPTCPSTSYGYLQLGPRRGTEAGQPVEQFREKPAEAIARQYFEDGPDRYLWNSGMFVWRAATVLDCIRRYEPSIAAGLDTIAEAWASAEQERVLADVFPTLKKISVDFAVMEPASRDPRVSVFALPMPLSWLDVGSWPMFAETLTEDEHGNRQSARALLMETEHSVVASNDPKHLVVTVGCKDLIVIHTPDATLICRKDRAESIKEVHKQVAERFGEELV